MYENINNDVVNIKKKILENKEAEIMKSQIIQNRLENAIKKLEIKKENIVKNNKWVLRNIIYTKIYDAITATILIMFVILFANKINLIISLHKTIYVIGLSFGVVAISIVGAYFSAVIREKLKNYYNKKMVVKITKNIREKEILLEKEINKQGCLINEITNLMNVLDSGLEIDVTEFKRDFVDYTVYDMLNIYEEKEKRKIKKVKKRIKSN